MDNTQLVKGIYDRMISSIQNRRQNLGTRSPGEAEQVVNMMEKLTKMHREGNHLLTGLTTSGNDALRIIDLACNNMVIQLYGLLSKEMGNLDQVLNRSATGHYTFSTEQGMVISNQAKALVNLMNAINFIQRFFEGQSLIQLAKL